ncbi:MAG: transcription elongation factor GreA [Clostridiales bacterium]|nr:transcription elongation factor GreA [Clostridiales bacterium]
MYEKITLEDKKRIEDEIRHRKLVIRPQAIKDVQEARAHGDLSENFEYKAAKQFKNQNESRIRYLEKVLRTAQIIASDTKDGEVGVNTLVTVYIPEDDEEETYKIVTSVRGNSLENRISIDSPLGRALLHHKVNDLVNVRVSDTYDYDVVIKNIEKFHDDGTDELRKY